MRDDDDRERVAHIALQLADRLAARVAADHGSIAADGARA